MIIGILIGIAIVFNWSTIKRVFDGGLGSAGAGAPATATAPPPPTSTAAAQPPAPTPDAHGDLSRATEQRLKDIAAGK